MTNRAVQSGLILGAISILFFLVGVVTEVGFTLQMVISLVGFVVSIIILSRFAIKERKLNGGAIKWGPLFGFLLLTYAIASLVTVLFSLLYVKVLDTNYVTEMIAKTQQFTLKLMQSAPQDKISEAMTKIADKMHSQFSLVGLLKQLVIGIIMGGVISAIIAAFVKR